jgi:hypothetical protein
MLAFMRLPVPPASKTKPTFPMSTGFSTTSEDADKRPIWREGGRRTKEATDVQSKAKERKDLIVQFNVIVFEGA